MILNILFKELALFKLVGTIQKQNKAKLNYAKKFNPVILIKQKSLLLFK